jgi:hypothetical protein
MLFRSHSIRTCTCARSLRIGDGGACAAERQEWEQRNKPVKISTCSVVNFGETHLATRSLAGAARRRTLNLARVLIWSRHAVLGWIASP